MASSRTERSIEVQLARLGKDWSSGTGASRLGINIAMAGHDICQRNQCLLPGADEARISHSVNVSQWVSETRADGKFP